MVYRKRPEELPDKHTVLHAMGRCRNAFVGAQHSVEPFGLTHRALALVVGAIDTAAWFFTGDSRFYAIGGSTADHPG